MAEISVVLLSYIIYVIGVESTGTLKPDLNADTAKDATAINEALSYWLTEESTFVEILPKRNCAQREEIYNKLDESYKNTDLSYNYEDGYICHVVMLCFYCTPEEYYKKWLWYGIQDIPFMNTKMIIELMVLLSFEDQNLRDRVFQGALEEETVQQYWERKVGDDLGNWGQEMMKRTRDPPDTKTDPEAAKADAKALIEEMQKNFDECRLKLDEVLDQRTAEQAQLVLDEFKTANGGTGIIDVLKDQLDGDIENAYMDLITCICEGRANYLAIRLKEVMDCAGTDDVNLGRLIVNLSEIDLVEVSAAFQEKYKKSLKSRMEEDISDFTKDFLFGFMGDLANTER